MTTTTSSSADAAWTSATTRPRSVVDPKGRSCLGWPRRVDAPAARTRAETLEDHGGPATAGDHADVARPAPENLLQRLLVGLRVRGHDYGGPLRQAELVEPHAYGVLSERRDRIVSGVTEGCERLDDRSVAHEHQKRLRKVGLHVDLQRAAAVTRHRVLEHPLRPARAPSAFSVEPDEPRPAVPEGVEGFSHDDWFRAGAADPAGYGAVGSNQCLGARLG